MDPLWVGAGAGVLGIIVTFLMPVSPHRVNQALIAAIIVVLFFAASFLIWRDNWILALAIAIAASGIAVLYRDVMRWVRHTLYDVTKYRRRDFWYRRVGQAVIGRGRGTRSRTR